MPSNTYNIALWVTLENRRDYIEFYFEIDEGDF